MAEVKIDIKSNGDEIVNTIGNIKKQIKDLRSQALAVGEGGAGFKKLTKEANELQDKLDDLKDSSHSLQGSGIEKLKASFGLLTESFKNADFGKAKTAFTGLGSAMKAIPIFLIVEGIMYLVENFDKLSQGSGFLAKALQFVGDIISKVTEGITWLLDKLGLVNAALDKQSEAFTKSGEKIKGTLDKQNTAFDQQIAILKANGKTTVEIEVAKQDAIIATNRMLVKQAIDLINAGGKLTKVQEEVALAAAAAVKQAQVDKEVVISAAETASAEKRKKHNEDSAAKKKKADEDYLNVLKTEQARLADVENAAIDNEEKRIKDAKVKAKADAIQAAKDMAAALEIIQGHNTNSRLFTLKVNYDAEVAAAKGNYATLALLDAKYEEDKAKIIKDGADAQKKLNDEAAALSFNKFKKQVEEVNKFTSAIGSGLNAVVGVFQAISDLNKQEAEQDTKERQAKLDTDISSLEDSKDRELAKTGLTEKQKIDIANKYAKIEYSMKLDEYNRSTEVKKKAFEQDKKLKIATAVISTITGAVSAFTGAMQLGPIAGPILGALLAAAVVATGAIQIAAIDATKFDAGTPPAAPKIVVPSSADVPGSGSQQGPQTGPSLFQAGQGDKNGGPNGNGQGSNQPIKAYVISQEVTSSQNMSNVIERRSSF